MKPLNILASYSYIAGIQDAIMEDRGRIRLLLDSGAFTAWKAGTTISLDEYCRFLETTKLPIWRYFVLDKIGDADETQRNLEIMLKRGFNPIPIFTRGEDPAHLDELYRVSDLVAVGGLVMTGGNTGFVKGIMRHIGERDCHWLGFTRMDWVKHYRPYSIDSSGWAAGVRYGCLNLYMGGGKYQRLGSEDFIDRPDPKIMRRLRELGIDPKRLGNRDQWRNFEGLALRDATYSSAIAASEDIEANLETKQFLVVSSGNQVRKMFRTREELMAA